MFFLLLFYIKFIKKNKKILPPDIAKYLTLFLGIIILLIFIFSIYRARIAAKCKVNNNIKFLQAHGSSWTIVKTNLSFLPVIGYLFKNKEEN